MAQDPVFFFRKYSLYSIVELNHCSFLNLRYPAPGLHDREILQ